MMQDLFGLAHLGQLDQALRAGLALAIRRLVSKEMAVDISKLAHRMDEVALQANAAYGRGSLRRWAQYATACRRNLEAERVTNRKWASYPPAVRRVARLVADEVLRNW